MEIENEKVRRTTPIKQEEKGGRRTELPKYNVVSK